MKYLTLASLVGISLAGCTKRHVLEVTITAPALSPMQLERELTVPLEVTLAGLPGACSTWSTTEPGKVCMYIEFESSRNEDRSAEIVSRLRFFESDLDSKPQVTFRELAAMPTLADGPSQPFLFVHPQPDALRDAGLADRDFWSQLGEHYDAKTPAEALGERLSMVEFLANGKRIPLMRLVKLELIVQPSLLARENGMRINQLNPIQQTPD
jgi:hypothetical protein